MQPRPPSSWTPSPRPHRASDAPSSRTAPASSSPASALGRAGIDDLVLEELLVAQVASVREVVGGVERVAGVDQALLLLGGRPRKRVHRRDVEVNEVDERLASFLDRLVVVLVEIDGLAVAEVGLRP